MTFSDTIAQIKSHINCIQYAQSIGLSITAPNQRCTSIAPGEHTHRDAFVIYSNNSWYDFTLGKGGDVIELSRWAKHNGDRAAAIRELADYCGIQIDQADIERTQSKRKELHDNVLKWHENLRPEDLDYLHSRRIHDDTIDALKIGYDEKTQRLIIPYTWNGDYVYYAARDRSGDPSAAKYKKAFLDNGNNGLENVPFGLDTMNRVNDRIVHTVFGDYRVDEIIAMSEGQFDILSFWQEGYKCLSPISGYFSSKYMPMVIDYCKNVKLVVMSFDNDKAGMNFTKSMAMKFIQNGIKFICVRLPKKIKDISDYYAPGGNLDDLVAHAVDGTKLFADTIINDPKKFAEFLNDYSSGIEDKKEFRQFLTDYARFMDKYEVIEICAQKKETFGVDFIKLCLRDALRAPSESILAQEILDRFNLMYVDNDGFYEYENGVWKRISDYLVRKYLANRLGEFKNNSRVGAVANLLKALCIRNVTFNKKNILNFQNGTLNLDSLELVAHTPDDLSTIQMSYDYDPNAKCEKWLKFIREIMSGDKRKMYLLQEACGYVLFPDCRLQKGFMLIGNGANGKSVFLAVLRNLFNPANCESIEISQLAQQFHAINLKDKLANFCSELGSEFKKAEAVFKKIISGNDAIYDSYKGKDGISFIPRVKNFFACNSYITSNHIDYSILRRLIFVKFNERFEGKNDNPHLLQELLTELPGIMNWVIEGYKRLVKRGKFISCKESDDTLRDFLYSVSPVDAFIREEFCDENYTYKYSIIEIYNKYKEWCIGAGHHSMSRMAFARTFKSNLEIHRKDVKSTVENNKEFFIFPPFSPEPENIYSDEDFLDDINHADHGHVEHEAKPEVNPGVKPELQPEVNTEVKNTTAQIAESESEQSSAQKHSERERVKTNAGTVNAKHAQDKPAASPFTGLYVRTAKYFSEHEVSTRTGRDPLTEAERQNIISRVCMDAVRKNYSEELVRNTIEGLFAEGKEKKVSLPFDKIKLEHSEDEPRKRSDLWYELDALVAEANALNEEEDKHKKQ